MKTQTNNSIRKKLNCIFTALAMSAGVHSVQAQVTNLGIGSAGNQYILYWPIGTTNFVLQTTSNLAAPNWVTASNAVTVNAAVVTNSVPVGYFRLLGQVNPIQGMALIPAGSFLMGNYLFCNSATNDPELTNATPVTIMVSAFYMDVNLVSFSQWANVYGYATANGYTFANAGAGKGANYPVESVNWFDCVAWCNARSAQAGLNPVYYSDAGFTQPYTNSTGTNVYLNMANSGYRLPTEAEWEKAARGGAKGNRFPWGDTISESQANYFGATASNAYDLGPNGFNAIGSLGGSAVGTSPVGSFAPNEYGLYDMAGNLFEWCWDWYGTPYGQPTTNNPTGVATGTLRVERGGYWNGDSGDARCCFRLDNYPSLEGQYVGFRCVKGP